MPELESLLSEITPPDESLAPAAQDRLDNLTKPPGALGRLEELAKRLCVMRGSLELTQPRAVAAVFAADHGVALSGVSPYPREVTAQMVLNFLAGGAAINALAGQAGAEVRVVDVGVDSDFPDHPHLIKAKVARGTGNLLEGPAMSEAQCRQAIAAGAGVAGELIQAGFDLLIPGEMGIGNTTPSAALAAAFCGVEPAAVTGRGTGLDDAGLARKKELVAQALELHKPDPAKPLAVLAALGGLEIAAICGFCLMAAARGVPVILDGLISCAGGLCAAELSPAARGWFLAGHASVEVGQRVMLARLGLTPILDLEMRLGEGTGAALAVQVLRGAVAMLTEMATFDSAGVSGKE